MAEIEETNTEPGAPNDVEEAREDEPKQTSRELTREVLEEVSESIPKVQARSYLDSEAAIARGVTRDQFVGHFGSIANAAEFETKILGSDRQYLPAEVIAVLDGGAATPGYWAFLVDAYERTRNR